MSATGATWSMPTGSAHVSILGLGTHRAQRVVQNAEIVAAIDSSDEWIQQRSGIKSRRWIGPGESLESMAFAAAQQALEAAGILAPSLDAVILATCSNTQQITALAPRIAHLLGAQGPVAFDIAAACAGFCQGLGIATDLVRSGTARHVLVIGVEQLSTLTSPSDRGTAFIFGDGAGAMVLGPSEVPGVGPVVWGSDGSHHSAIELSADWVEAISASEPVLPHITMEGATVFRWASYEMAKIAHATLDRTGISVEDLDLFIPHQANMRIIDAMAKAIGLPDRVRIARDIAEQGNTSAASIPLALARMYEDGTARSGDLALLIAFGAGLSYAAQVIRVP